MSAKWIRLKLRAIGARRLTLLAAMAAFALFTFSTSLATADVSHAGWPHTVTVAFASNAGGVLVGTDGNDMLLGGPGNDTIYGGPGNDIIWGDQHPVPDNPTSQHDVLYGGPGNDWIYTSHGYNAVYGGPGNDHIFAYFGHGKINCGPGYDIVTLSNPAAYTTVNCEVVRRGVP
jgi:hypothetical protein